MLKYAKVITYADDTVIFTSSNDFNIIENHLNEDVLSLATWFCENEWGGGLQHGDIHAVGQIGPPCARWLVLGAVVSLVASLAAAAVVGVA